MCPACMTSIALIVAGSSSASGLAVLALTRLSTRKRPRVRPRKPWAGGKILVDRSGGSQHGTSCLFTDPERRTLGLWQPLVDRKSRATTLQKNFKER
jgi:hypothetical protein